MEFVIIKEKEEKKTNRKWKVNRKLAIL